MSHTRVDAEGAEVGEPRRDPREVAEAVAVGVGEAADVDLVEHGVAPPRSGGLACSSWCRRGAHAKAAGSTAIQRCSALPTTRPSASYRVDGGPGLAALAPAAHPDHHVLLADDRERVEAGRHPGQDHQSLLEVAGPAADAVERGPGHRDGSRAAARRRRVVVLGDATRRASRWRRRAAAAPRPARRVASVTRPGKMRRPSPSARPVPQEKQVGNGWLAQPANDGIAARASSGRTGSTSVIASWLQRADSTGRPSYVAVTPPSSVAVTDSGTSSGGGACSETVTAGQGRAWCVSGARLGGVGADRDRPGAPASVAGRRRPAEA